MSLFDLFPLPPDLDPVFLAWLETHVAALAPRDSYEILLVGRIAQALARLHRSALNEPPGPPNNLWLRYEAAADRLYRQSLSALHKYRKEHPVEPQDATESTPQPASPPHHPADLPDAPEPTLHDSPNPLPGFPHPDHARLNPLAPDPSTPTDLESFLSFPSAASWSPPAPSDGATLDPKPGGPTLGRHNLAQENGRPDIHHHDTP
ncbi:MAG: hypothetical protein KatS3mg108_2516 [Isosphaeraceae bacterium]|nr:MAG: hypothetical protein KatS3mg108_2516 [Isosphaeraceae bacterium]